MRRVGRTKKNAVCYKYGEKFRWWKGCTEKMTIMIVEKKEMCWRTYCEENGGRDSCDIVRLAKDL